MNKIFLLGLLLWAGCAGGKYERAAPGELPQPMPNWDIQKSRHFAELERTYGKGPAYEKAKIKYLLGETSRSPYSFDRNGWVYGGPRTSRHLRKKYLQRIQKIKTAQDFIDKVASISTASGRPYLALPGDGRAYRTGDILNYELRRLENFMDELHAAGNAGRAEAEA